MMAAARMPGLPAHPIVMIYDDLRQLGTFSRGGRDVKVSLTLQGWWCEARAFGEAEYAVNYETQVTVPPAPGTPEEVLQQDRARQEQYETFARECNSIFGEMATGRRFMMADRSGHFIKGLENFGLEAVKNISAAIESYNLAQGETPEAIIAKLGVQPSPIANDESGMAE